MSRVEALGDVRIPRGIPDVVVDPVGDPEQPVAQRAERVAQSEAAVGRLQLARVRRAHGDDSVCRDDPALEPIHLVVPLQELPVEQLPREADLGQRRRREMSLIAGVVDRQNRGDTPVVRMPRQERPQVHEHHGRVPVVRVQNRVGGGDARQRGERRKGEEGEAPVIIGIVPSFAVQRRPIEEPRMLHENHVGAAAHAFGPPQPAGFSGGPELHRDGRPERFHRGNHGADLLVERHHDCGRQARGGLVRGQTGDGLSETSRARVGPALGDHVDDRDWFAVVRAQHGLARSGARAGGRSTLTRLGFRRFGRSDHDATDKSDCSMPNRRFCRVGGGYC